MTVAYASPEQVRGDRSINVATDVYSLGVILYELLTGQKPHGEGEATPQATMRAVLEMEPKSPRSLDASIPRELEAIVMKAMRKDATERYATVEELRLDCNRFLQGMPVEAMRGGQVYRLRKFAARHRATLTIAALVLGFATFGVASVLHYARQADARLRDVILVNQDIMSELQLIPGRQQIELQLLRRSVEALERIWRSTRSMEAAEVLTDALLEIGRTSGYPSGRGIGDTKTAERHYQLALDVGDWMMRSNLRNPHFAAKASIALCALGAIFIEQNRYNEAERLIRMSVEITRPDAYMPRHEGKEAAYQESLAHLSRIYLHNGNRDECLRVRRQVVELARATVKEDARSDAKKFVLAGRLALLGWAQREFGQLEDALASYNESVEILRNATEPGQGFERRHVEAMNRQQIGRTLSAMRRWKDAKLAFEASIAAFQRLRKDDPLNVACQRGLAGSLAYLAVEEQRAAANHPLARQHAAESTRLMKDLIAKDPLNQKAKEELREFETLLRLPGSDGSGHR